MSRELSSRYRESTVNVDGNSVTVSVRAPSFSTKYSTYLTQELDSFESIASRALGDPTRWWEIADINTHVKYPNFIPIGTTIRIPS
jgi:nucleoid-associated protein YgaU